MQLFLLSTAALDHLQQPVMCGSMSGVILLRLRVGTKERASISTLGSLTSSRADKEGCDGP